MQGAVQSRLRRLVRFVALWWRSPWVLPPADYRVDWSRKEIGNWGERWVAWHYFHRRAGAIIARNWRGGGGELDLVVREGNCLVFVEVKTRDADNPEPLAQVRDEKRQLHFQRAAAAYRARLGRPRPPVRFDVVLVTPNPKRPDQPQIDCLLDVMKTAEFEETEMAPSLSELQ